eukprot:TRINITY_DN31786_c0_g1_i1.p1 TRINITY_DN31786_c0_g1~~TRINITY_DN31786_c0_g1_i1.p1  ORF type:complete len:420 (+),score=106.10 TRINITY_DN31786_c0_g1_i1:94-1260(+)
MSPALQAMAKRPLGGVDLRQMAVLIKAEGRSAADRQLQTDLARLRPVPAVLPENHGVVVLGGSNGITRAIALQLSFGQRVPVWCVHSDNPRMQIAYQHAQSAAARAEAENVPLKYRNVSAIADGVAQEVAAEMRAAGVRSASLINGIAAGVPKRYAQFGPCAVPELDCAFHPVLQTPDFGTPAAYRSIGLVDVGVASDQEVQRTMDLMGSAPQTAWAAALAGEGLLSSASVLAFCDYDYPNWDPVYAHGPLAGAKQAQRGELRQLRAQYSARPASLCFPPMPTSALGAIPGGLLLYAATAELLLRSGRSDSLRSCGELAASAVSQLWPHPESLPTVGYVSVFVRMDNDFQHVLADYKRWLEGLPDALAAAGGSPAALFPLLLQHAAAA